jgi:outer membrane protein OmpA-like peptidoglycan-associated protein
MKRTYGYIVTLFILLLTWQTVFAQETKPTAKDWYQQGLAYESQAVYGEAINMFTAAIELDPTFADAYLHRGMAYRIYAISATREALEDFTTVILLAPKNAEAYYQRGLLNEFTLNNEASKSDMITAAGLGHEGAKNWLLSLNNQAPPAVTAPAVTPPPEAEAPAPSCHAQASAPEGFDLADYLPSGIQPIIYFDFNKSDLKSEAFPTLDAVAAVLKEKLSEASILVVGHTDNTGTERYNAGLSLRRAEAVKTYLTSQGGIATERISAEGYGEMAPADSNETEEGRAHNRRAAITGIQK